MHNSQSDKTIRNHYPIIIVGGGPIGLTCGIESQKAGIESLIIEKGTIVNSLFNYPRNMTFFSSSERLELDNIPFVSINSKPNRNEALEYYRRIADVKKLNIHLFEKIESIQKSDSGIFNIISDKSNYTANNVIIATGFYDLPYLLNVPGEALPKVKHYYDDPHMYAFQKVVVVGAMNSAVDAALETWRKGADVTMVIRGSEIGTRVKYWVKPDIENRIKEGSIKAYFNSEIVKIEKDSVEISTPEGPLTLPNDWVLALTGYQPNIEFLRNTGIRLSDDEQLKPEYNETTYETNIKGLYVAGVVCGGMDTHSYFIENSREHAKAIVRSIVMNNE